MNLILHPAGDARGDETDYHGTSRQRLAPLLSYFNASEQDLLRAEFPDGTGYWRGATVSLNGTNETRWNKINPGDRALFFRDNTLIGSGKVVLHVKSRDLASALKFSDDAKTKLPYELIYVVKDVKVWDIPRQEVWEKIGYKPHDQFGLRVITDERADHVIQWLDSLITKDEYQNDLRRLLQLESTDLEITAIARREQAFWQQFLFKDRDMGTCALCGAVLPTNLMVVAHIKPRHLCSHEERLDPHNVMPACVFGCDALFDKRVVYVEDRIIRTSNSDLTGDLRRWIEQLLGKECSYWNEASAKYFIEHAKAARDRPYVKSIR